MNESQKRREELLRSTRKLYDSGNPGRAVHPRYRSERIWHEEEKKESSSLGIRLLFSMLLFLTVVFVEHYDPNLYFTIVECIMGK